MYYLLKGGGEVRSPQAYIIHSSEQIQVQTY